MCGVGIRRGWGGSLPRGQLLLLLRSVLCVKIELGVVSLAELTETRKQASRTEKRLMKR